MRDGRERREEEGGRGERRSIARDKKKAHTHFTHQPKRTPEAEHREKRNASGNDEISRLDLDRERYIADECKCGNNPKRTHHFRREPDTDLRWLLTMSENRVLLHTIENDPLQKGDPVDKWRPRSDNT